MIVSAAPLLFALASLSFSFTSAQSVIYEAESGTLSGTKVDTAYSGYSGTGYVTNSVDSTTSLTITVNAPSSGLYDFAVTYNAPYGEKYTAVSVNGVANGEIHFPATTVWTTVSGGQLLLTQGSSTITFSTDWGWYLIDKISIAPSAPPAPHQVTGALMNPNASGATKTLMAYLTSLYGKHMLSGQQDPASYQWVEENVGKSPAIIGLDMIDYSPSRVAFQGNVSTTVEDAITYDAFGTIVALVWHWNAPNCLYNNATEEWWSGFYTAATCFNIADVMANPNGTDYALMISDMDAIATQLKRIQAANIPVMWRPLHEAEGGWFWWGAHGSGPCKQLYRLMYDRFTNYHGLNNLIWIWNSVSADWYPGDDVVDMLTYDSYPSTTGDHGAVSSTYGALVTLGKDQKLVGLAEVGEIPDPSLLPIYHADWVYFVTWSGDYISGGQHNSLAYLTTIYTPSYLLTRDETTGWKSFNGGSTTTTTSTTSAKPTSTTTTTATSITTLPTTKVTSTTSTAKTSSTTKTTTTKSTTTTIKLTTSTTKSTTTTKATATTPKSTTMTTTASGAIQTHWGQCAGIGYPGPTNCASPYTCIFSNPYYSQCL